MVAWKKGNNGRGVETFLKWRSNQNLLRLRAEIPSQIGLAVEKYQFNGKDALNLAPDFQNCLCNDFGSNIVIEVRIL